MHQRDFESLHNVLIPFAKKQLAKRGSFLPFGASIKKDGTLALAAALPEGSTSREEETIEILERAFSDAATRREIRSVGMCVDVRVIPPGKTQKIDAIMCCLEHETGAAVNIVVPYEKKWFNRYSYGAQYEEPAEQRTFIGNAT